MNELPNEPLHILYCDEPESFPQKMWKGLRFEKWKLLGVKDWNPCKKVFHTSFHLRFRLFMFVGGLDEGCKDGTGVD